MTTLKSRVTRTRASLAAALAITGLAWACAPAQARSFTIAQAVDVQTLDPHGTTETNTLGVIMNIYEALVRRGRDMAIEPGLATSWQLVEPTRWRFKLRQGVHFHDGALLSVDDVIFSLKRAQSDTSDAKPAVRAIARIDKIDDATFDVVTTAPDPILLAEICNFYIVSKSWAEQNKAEVPYTPTRGAGVENFAVRHADGTGPFMLRSYEAGQQVALQRNPAWWDKPQNDLTEVIFATVGADATRISALLSGSVDAINPVPEQATAQISSDARFHVLRGSRPAVMYLGLNQASEALKQAHAGADPFKDLRVRQAMYAAIDDVALRQRVMRGAALEVGSMIPNGVEGFSPDMGKHPPADLDHARELMKQAGYADGFATELDCTNDQYPLDQEACTAIAAMLARINIKVDVHAQSRARFFPRVTSGDTDFYLMAWYAPTFDAHHILWNTLQTKGHGNGIWNATGWSDAGFDKLVDAISVEMDPAKRRQLIGEADRIERDQMVYLPLYQLTIAVAAKAGVDLVLRPDNRIDLRFVSVK